jgi:hypothetical protein
MVCRQPAQTKDGTIYEAFFAPLTGEKRERKRLVKIRLTSQLRSKSAQSIFRHSKFELQV